MAQLRSLLALRSFMRACGEAVEEAEAVCTICNTRQSVEEFGFAGLVFKMPLLSVNIELILKLLGSLLKVFG